MREVKAEIDKSGKVRIEFIGFRGDECAEERERIRKIMQDLGVTLEIKEVRKKTAQEILGELRLSGEKTRERLGVT
jgi:hypothetical protein